jgi:sorbitol/mannitol transport system permease protein
MATQHSRSAARLMMAPAVILLLGWMLVPLTMTLWFSFTQYLPMRGDSIERGLDWVGFENYVRFIGSSSFWPSVQATLMIVGGVLVITVVLGVLLAILLDQPMWGQGVVRILVIAPVLRHADGVRAGLEEHVHGPRERHVRPSVRACSVPTRCRGFRTPRCNPSS